MTEEERFAFLARVMLETRKNKRRGRDWSDFEYRSVIELIRMFDALESRTFRIDHNYAFLTDYPKWREIFATSPLGRIADHLLCDTLRPYIESTLHPRTFNNRIGKGSQAAINQVLEDITEVTAFPASGGFPARIIKWDLKAFFPNALCDYMQQCFDRIIDANASSISAHFGFPEMPSFLHWLAMICIHCNPTAHCSLRTPPQLWRDHIPPEKSLFGKPAGIGTPIGRMTSQTGMGLYINDEVAWLNDTCGIRTTVFMDDGVMVVPEHLHHYALSLLPVLRKRLAAKGILLNDKKFYDQPYQHGLEFLGTHIHTDRLILNDKTYARAVDRLQEYNALPTREKFSTLDHFLSSFNSYTGLLKNRTSYHRIQHLFFLIHPDYLQWLDIDHRRQCLVCKPAFSPNSRLAQKYHLHLRKISA